MAGEISNDLGFRLTAERNGRTTAAYLYLPNHPASAGCVARTVRLDSVLDNKGRPEIMLDLDAFGAVIGIEILT
jgi:uncharacterized protein YuzE